MSDLLLLTKFFTLLFNTARILNVLEFLKLTY